MSADVVPFPTEVLEVREPQGWVTATAFRWIDPTKIPTRKWLIGRHAIRGFLSVTGAPGGLGKSSLVIAEALALITGRPLLGDAVPTSGRCWYLGLEDPREEYERRFVAAALAHQVWPWEMERGLFLDSGRDQQFVIANEGRDGLVINEPFVDSVIANIREKCIDYVIVDPFVASHAVSESENSKIARVAQAWASIAEMTGAAIELVHHVRKGTASTEASSDDLRGASALTNAARAVRILKVMRTDEGTRFGVPEEQCRSIFRVEAVKGNMTSGTGQRPWRQLESVSLGNGQGGVSDEVGVVKRWEPPSLSSSLPGNAEERVLSILEEGGQFRQSPQADDWLGNEIIDNFALDKNDPLTAVSVKRLLYQMEKAGKIRKAHTHSEKGRKVPVYEAAA